jgi:hypothetical protein
MNSPLRMPALRSREGLALALIILAGVALRLWRAWHAAWYWDEGYLTEISGDLARGLRPRSGALWFNGLLPLTTSWLAPLSAAPFHWLVPGPGLWAVRVWACTLESVSLLAVARIGWALGGPVAGLGAAAVLALGPLPVTLGSLGLYHHLGSALALLAWVAALEPQPPDGRGPRWGPYLLAGLAVLACYWLWWVPLGLLFWRPRSRPLAWPWRLLLLGGPLALQGAWLLGRGGPDAGAMMGSLASFSAPWGGLGVLLVSARAYPLAWGGLALMALLPRGQRWAWVAWLGLADAVRQRGDLEGSPYVLLVLLPWASVGVGLGLAWLGRRSRGLALVALPLVLIAAGIGSTEWIGRLSVAPPLGRNLANFLRAQGLGSETVVTTPNVAWALRGLCRPVELSQAAAARGWGGGFLPAHLSPAAFAYDPSLEKARYLVLCQADFDSLFLDGRQALEALVAEREGWPLAFKNPAFVVYEDPRFGAHRDPGVRILHDPVFYWRAAAWAQREGRPQWVAFARARALAGFVP